MIFHGVWCCLALLLLLLCLCFLSFQAIYFSKTTKSTADLFKGKTYRLLIPFLFTMFLIELMKSLVFPKEMCYNPAVDGGLKTLISNALVHDKNFTL